MFVLKFWQLLPICADHECSQIKKTDQETNEVYSKAIVYNRYNTISCVVIICIVFMQLMIYFKNIDFTKPSGSCNKLNSMHGRVHPN